MIQMDNVNKPCWLVIYFSTLFLATPFYSHFLCLWDPYSHTQSHLNFSSAHAAWRQLHCASGNLWIWLQVSEFVKPVETALVRDTYTDTHTQKARGILISIPLCHQFTTQSIYLSFLYWICEQLALSCCAPPLPSTFEEQRYSDRDNSMIVWSLYPFALLVTAPSAAEGFTVSFWLKAQLLSCQTLVFSCHSNLYEKGGMHFFKTIPLKNKKRYRE